MKVFRPLTIIVHAALGAFVLFGRKALDLESVYLKATATRRKARERRRRIRKHERQIARGKGH